MNIGTAREKSLWLSVGVDLFSRDVSIQVFSTRMSLTSVFGMGTGGTSLPLTPTVFLHPFWYPENQTASIMDRVIFIHFWKSPRPISTRWLNMSPCLHLAPINLLVFEGSYSLEVMGYLILRTASRLDAFSVYPIRT